MNNSKLLSANDEYVQQTKKYGRIDALFALILYISMILLFVLMGKIFLRNISAMTDTYIFCVTGIFTLIPVSLVFLFCLIRKQKLETVGFSKNHAIKSFIVGMILFVSVVILRGIMPVISGSTVQTDISRIVMQLFYYLFFIGFMEELVFRGYIATRLYGCFKNKPLSIVIVGIMFAFLHIPFKMLVTHMSMLEYISVNWNVLFNIFITHFIMQWLYSKYNSIIAPTILHFILDFIGWFII